MLRPCALAVLTLAGLGAAASAGAHVPPGSANQAVPSCSAEATATTHADLRDWDRTLLDPVHALPADYAPDDLVPVTEAGVQGAGLVRALVVEDLAAMARDASDAGAAFAVHSAYRSHEEQDRIFTSLVNAYGPQRAAEVSARPGHSEHQLGTALDLRSADSPLAAWQYDDWGATAPGAWLAANSWRYGFVLSYPPGRSDVTCYDEESWHFRYLGRERAAAIHDSGLTAREHLAAGEGLSPPGRTSRVSPGIGARGVTYYLVV